VCNHCAKTNISRNILEISDTSKYTIIKETIRQNNVLVAFDIMEAWLDRGEIISILAFIRSLAKLQSDITECAHRISIIVLLRRCVMSVEDISIYNFLKYYADQTVSCVSFGNNLKSITLRLDLMPNTRRKRSMKAMKIELDILHRTISDVQDIEANALDSSQQSTALQANLPFNLDLNERGKLSKSSVDLPFVRAQSSVITQASGEDDDDCYFEDPDDDLEI
jgi:hypothetical protein